MEYLVTLRPSDRPRLPFITSASLKTHNPGYLASLDSSGTFFRGRKGTFGGGGGGEKQTNIVFLASNLMSPHEALDGKRGHCFGRITKGY